MGLVGSMTRRDVLAKALEIATDLVIVVILGAAVFTVGVCFWVSWRR